MTKNLPKVSVMIPTYNQENYIAQAIESVLMQDYENLEIIVADDCSTDTTGEIARRYIKDRRVKYIRNSHNLGRVGNYRHTLYATTGEWVINLDGDDYYTDRGFISRIIRAILTQSNVVCFFGIKQLRSNLKSYTKYRIGKDQYCMPGKLYLENYDRIGSFAHLATFYKREIAINDGLCYTFDGIQSDFHAIIRLCVYGNIIISKENGYQWRAHHGNATNNFYDFRMKYGQGIRCQYKIMDDISDIYLTKSEKENWLKKVRKNAQRMYVMDELSFVHNWHSLKIGIMNFQFRRGYMILYIKSALSTIFHINLFK